MITAPIFQTSTLKKLQKKRVKKKVNKKKAKKK